MGQQLQVTATFPSIASENLAQFKEAAAAALEITKAESGTRQYDWFFNQDETSCVVRETYEDSDAVLAHLNNVGDLLGKLMELGSGLEVEVFGTPSAKLLEVASGLQPTVHTFFQGK